MWHGLDPDLQRQLDFVRAAFRRSRQTPTNEWPVLHVEERDALLVVREWPDGTLTAYIAVYSDFVRDARRS
jgi:hypothetical protein